MLDLNVIASTRRQELLQEADHERLLASLPRRDAGLRRQVAVACHRLADWLDDPRQYLRSADPVPGDWVFEAAEP